MSKMAKKGESGLVGYLFYFGSYSCGEGCFYFIRVEFRRVKCRGWK